MLVVSEKINGIKPRLICLESHFWPEMSRVVKERCVAIMISEAGSSRFHSKDEHANIFEGTCTNVMNILWRILCSGPIPCVGIYAGHLSIRQEHISQCGEIHFGVICQVMMNYLPISDEGNMRWRVLFCKLLNDWVRTVGIYACQVEWLNPVYCKSFLSKVVEI